MTTFLKMQSKRINQFFEALKEWVAFCKSILHKL